MGCRPLALLLTVLAACGPSAPPSTAPPPAPLASGYAPTQGLEGAVTVAFALPKALTDPQPGGFYGMPWPSELWRQPDGKLDFSSFPGRDSFLVGGAVTESDQEIDAFSVNPVVYFHFTDPIDPKGLPPPQDTGQPTALVALINIDPASPARGQAIPLEHRWYGAAQRYVPANTLALKPLPGFVLRPATLYAAVVQRRLSQPALGTTRDLELTKWTQPHQRPAVERARRLHAPVLDTLAELGVPRDQVAGLAVFRTQNPTAVFQAMIEVAAQLPPPLAPRLLRAAWLDDRAPPTAPYRVLRGYYCTPNFQRDIDSVPFMKRGGTVVLGPQGRPEVQPIPADSPFRTAECGDLLRARFVLTLPRKPMPAAGWPLLVVAHGTTGDAFTFAAEDNFAGWAAQEGIAAVSTDQPLHGGLDPVGARPGSRKPFKVTFGGIPIRIPHPGRGSELAFYNPLRPAVLRDNLRQAGIDSVVLATLMLATDFAKQRTNDGGWVLPPSPDRAAPRFDGNRLMVAGHSQGSQSIAAHGAINPAVRGVLLSGCGGDLRLGVTRRRDTNALAVVKLLLNLADGELDEFHPLLSLMQTTVDPVDPLSYGRLYHERPATQPPLSVLHFEGIGDTMTVVEMAEALAVALRAQPLEPLPRPVPGLTLLGIAAAPIVQGNAASGRGTIALAQLAPTQGEDGHFVMHYEPAGERLVRQFLRALVNQEAPPILGPLNLSPR